MSPEERERVLTRYHEQRRAEERAREEGRPRTLANGLRVGHYTGRCGACGSSNLWDDNGAYGCKSCGAWWCGFAG